MFDDIDDFLRKNLERFPIWAEVEEKEDWHFDDNQIVNRYAEGEAITWLGTHLPFSFTWSNYRLDMRLRFTSKTGSAGVRFNIFREDDYKNNGDHYEVEVTPSKFLITFTAQRDNKKEFKSKKIWSNT